MRLATPVGRVPTGKRPRPTLIGSTVEDARPNKNALEGVTSPSRPRVHAALAASAVHDGLPHVARLAGRPTRSPATAAPVAVPVHGRELPEETPAAAPTGGASRRPEAAAARHPVTPSRRGIPTETATTAAHQPLQHLVGCSTAIPPAPCLKGCGACPVRVGHIVGYGPAAGTRSATLVANVHSPRASLAGHPRPPNTEESTTA